jgi:hypothetical protein
MFKIMKRGFNVRLNHFTYFNFIYGSLYIYIYTLLRFKLLRHNTFYHILHVHTYSILQYSVIRHFMLDILRRNANFLREKRYRSEFFLLSKWSEFRMIRSKFCTSSQIMINSIKSKVLVWKFVHGKDMSNKFWEKFYDLNRWRHPNKAALFIYHVVPTPSKVNSLITTYICLRILNFGSKCLTFL